MMVCPNCGAQIEKDITKCPYCGYINKEAAEKKFREDLGEIQRNIEETKKEPKKALVKGITGGTKVILIISCILILLSTSVSAGSISGCVILIRPLKRLGLPKTI